MQFAICSETKPTFSWYLGAIDMFKKNGTTSIIFVPLLVYKQQIIYTKKKRSPHVILLPGYVKNLSN